jgi:hypothetical protein
MPAKGELALARWSRLPAGLFLEEWPAWFSIPVNAMLGSSRHPKLKTMA